MNASEPSSKYLELSRYVLLGLFVIIASCGLLYTLIQAFPESVHGTLDLQLSLENSKAVEILSTWKDKNNLLATVPASLSKDDAFIQLYAFIGSIGIIVAGLSCFVLGGQKPSLLVTVIAEAALLLGALCDSHENSYLREL